MHERAPEGIVAQLTFGGKIHVLNLFPPYTSGNMHAFMNTIMDLMETLNVPCSDTGLMASRVPEYVIFDAQTMEPEKEVNSVIETKEKLRDFKQFEKEFKMVWKQIEKQL